MKYFKHQMILNLLFKDRVYSATHKGWGFNDDLKLFKYDDIKINFYNLFLITFFILNDLSKKKN